MHNRGKILKQIQKYSSVRLKCTKKKLLGLSDMLFPWPFCITEQC